MATSRNHQQAHGIGQIEQQLSAQADAAEEIQGGKNETDRAIEQKARESSSELDEIIDS
jgi:hypothetical protein